MPRVSESESNPFLIQLPPGIAPKPEAQPEPIAEPVDPSTVISVPPGVDSATFRLPATRAVDAPPAAVAAPPVAAPLVGRAVSFAPPPPPPAAPVAPPAPVPPPVHAAVWTLDRPHGDSAVVVVGAVVIGRGPSALPEYPGAQLVQANDPSKSISKTHALIGVDDDGLWVADLGSTNGTFVVTTSGEETQVQPGAPVRVSADSTIELGQYVIRVDRR